VITIESLHVYPVKSCRGIDLDEAHLEPAGIEHDREWMIVTPQGRFLTQREVPQLALIRPCLAADTLTLETAGREPIAVPIDATGTSLEVTIWRDRCAAVDLGNEPARWLSEFLGRDVRLVRFAPDAMRPSDSAWTGAVAGYSRFADAFALLAISAASFADLNGRLHTPLPRNRFRPNVVLAGLDAYGEDELDELWTRNVRLRAVKPCTRCAITTTDQDRGAVDGAEPLRTLRTYRWSKELRGVAFGQNLIVLEPGTLAVGDVVHASRKS
jgi:MOSC domain-containing protein